MPKPQEVFDFIGRSLHWAERLSMRDYTLAWELKCAGMDWRGWILARWGMSGTRLLVAKLKAGPSFRTEAQRVRAFLAQQGGCRATYYNHVKGLGRPVELPELPLSNPPPDRTPPETNLLDLLRRRFGILGGDEPL